jgi:hypothetical protein
MVVWNSSLVLVRRAIRASAIVAGIAALTIFVAGAAAFADDAPVAESDWDTVNRVLEIPQRCTHDGVVISCEPGASNTGQVPEQNAGNGGEETTASTGPNSGNDYNVPEIEPDWGSVDDYENQTIEESPVYVGLPAGYGRTPAYATPHLAPTTTMISPAWTPPPFGSGPWMIPPSAMMRPAPAPITIMRPPFSLH